MARCATVKECFANCLVCLFCPLICCFSFFAACWNFITCHHVPFHQRFATACLSFHVWKLSAIHEHSDETLGQSLHSKVIESVIRMSPYRLTPDNIKTIRARVDQGSIFQQPPKDIKKMNVLLPRPDGTSLRCRWLIPPTYRPKAFHPITSGVDPNNLQSPIPLPIPTPVQPTRKVNERTPIIREDHTITIRDDSATAIPEPCDRVILYLHGGGYVFGSIASHQRVVSELARRSHAVALLLEYRLAPEHPLPAQTEDALLGYDYLINICKISPENIVIAGDSAGGGLTALTLMALRDRELHKQQHTEAKFPLLSVLPPSEASAVVGAGSVSAGPAEQGIEVLVDPSRSAPALPPFAACGVMMSPWVDLATMRPSILDNEQTDFILRTDATVKISEGFPVLQSMVTGTDITDVEARKDPKFSPIYGSCRGFPPLYMCVGTFERLMSDGVDFAAKARAEGVSVELTMGSKMQHVYPIFWDYIPEGARELTQMGEFIRAHVQ